MPSLAGWPGWLAGFKPWQIDGAPLPALPAQPLPHPAVAHYLAQAHCYTPPWHLQHCLWENQGALDDFKCKAELFRQAAEESDDIRLSVGLLKACHDDKKKVGTGGLSS